MSGRVRYLFREFDFCKATSEPGQKYCSAYKEKRVATLLLHHYNLPLLDIPMASSMYFVSMKVKAKKKHFPGLRLSCAKAKRKTSEACVNKLNGVSELSLAFGEGYRQFLIW